MSDSSHKDQMSRSPSALTPPSLKLPSPSSSTPSLDDLLVDCFHFSLDSSSLCPERLNYAKSFINYLSSVHCLENLAFLMEIFKYEYYYDKIHPENFLLQRAQVYSSSAAPPPANCHHPASSLSSSFLNSSLERSIDTLPFPSSRNLRKGRRDSLSLEKTQSPSSQSSYTNGFEFGFDAHLADPSNDAWDKFKQENVSDSDSNDSESLNDSLDSLDKESLLIHQWKHIIHSFILKDAPQQLNLDNDTVKYLLDLDATPNIHKPMVLLAAKAKVMQILQENVYGSFLAIMRESAGGSNSHSRESSMSSPNSRSSQQSPCQIRYSASASQSPSNITYSGKSSPGVVPQCPCVCSSTTSSSNESTSYHQMACPVPVSRRKRLFPHIGTHSDSSSNGSDFSISGILNSLKNKDLSTIHQSTASSLRNAMAPQSASAYNSQCALPISVGNDELLRPSSTSDLGLILRLGKFWKRKR